nr:dienelactone hydrolase family protein [Pseudomonas sp. 2FG]
MGTPTGLQQRQMTFSLDQAHLHGEWVAPEGAEGLVVFVHGSGSSRFSPRNRSVARYFNDLGLATLLFDLLTEAEQRVDEVSRAFRFDIPLLSQRLSQVIDCLRRDAAAGELAIGLFGASTGAAAALITAAERPREIAAVVSRGGRSDLAGSALARVEAPTLLIVGAEDDTVLALNRQSSQQLHCPQRLAVIPGATHLFEESGKLLEVAELAGDWFLEHLQRRSVA